jgi:hypothetical protein
MDVATHPHIGLSTVTWLIAGEVLHKDSLGTEARIRPGQLNWMTAGDGICHSEETPPDYHGPMHGVQLWVASPEVSRRGPPSFQHHPDLPALTLGAAQATVAVGRVGDAVSPARSETPCMAVDVLFSGGQGSVPLDPTFEHAAVVTEGEVRVEGALLSPGELVYLGRRRTSLELEAALGARLFLIGGEPLGEPVLMWWNFVARTPEEIAQARADWEAGSPRFGENRGYNRRPRLGAPVL